MKLKPYDEDELICDIVEARLPLQEVARKHGLSPGLLHSILAGRTRRDILRKVVKLWALARHDVRRACAANVNDLLGLHIETGRTDKGHVGRQCREFILKQALREGDFRFGDEPSRSGTPAARWTKLRKAIERPSNGGPDER